MYKLNIDKSFFDFDSPKSKGLISGLKKLSGKGFYFYSDGINSKTNSSLQKIFKSENIFSIIKDVKVSQKNFQSKKKKTLNQQLKKFFHN